MSIQCRSLKLHHGATFWDEKLTVLGVHDVKANGLIVGEEGNPIT